MKNFVDYIEKSCANLKDDHTTYRYKKKLLDKMTARANEVISTGLKDEKVLTDLIADEFGDLEAGYQDFLADEKKARRKKMIKIGFPVGGLVTILLLLAVYFTVSDLTGAWNKTWLIIVGGIFSLVIFYLSFAIRKLCHMRKVFHPIARILIFGCVMLATVFAFLFFLMMFPALTTWPILMGGVIAALAADLAFAYTTKQKFRTISFFVYMPVIAAMLYIMLAAYGAVTWAAGWPVILAGVVADVGYIISIIMSNMKYFMYRQEDDE